MAASAWLVTSSPFGAVWLPADPAFPLYHRVISYRGLPLRAVRRSGARVSRAGPPQFPAGRRKEGRQVRATNATEAAPPRKRTARQTHLVLDLRRTHSYDGCGPALRCADDDETHETARVAEASLTSCFKWGETSLRRSKNVRKQRSSSPIYAREHKKWPFHSMGGHFFMCSLVVRASFMLTSIKLLFASKKLIDLFL